MSTTKHNDTSNRGFAAMSKEKVSEIAQKGGKARAKQTGSKGHTETGHKGSASSSKHK